jgi:hypothetical protein
MKNDPPTGIIGLIIKEVKTLQEAKALPKKIEIVGRRWFNKNKGSTYHSVIAWVDNVEVVNVPYSYGYGSQYFDTAWDQLVKLGIVPQVKAPHVWAQENGIILVYFANNVTRKKDL